MKNQLLIQKEQFRFIPQAAEIQFKKSFDWWYEEICDKQNLLAIKEYMMFDGSDTHLIMTDILSEIGELYYVFGDDPTKFPSETFPLDKASWTDDMWEGHQRAFPDVVDDMEIKFLLDIKRYMDVHHICYVDNMDWGSSQNLFGGYQNMAVKSVW